jgi:hypothetical protein
MEARGHLGDRGAPLPVRVVGNPWVIGGKLESIDIDHTVSLTPTPAIVQRLTNPEASCTPNHRFASQIDGCGERTGC